ncbi:hypothetical protein WR25_07404 [Diploscapter pachys]|uniref:Uncharacterized protein n=1 Tax=Diploscapter pachys TaxID=2018661 RepID=A0A2A2KRF7_9BILA|nr:hypothetical protein WR25_07404 [Diploscapter pachys]
MNSGGRGEEGNDERRGEGPPAANRPKKPFLRRGQGMQKYQHKMRFPVMEKTSTKQPTGFHLPLRQQESRPTSTSDYGTGRSEFSPRSTSSNGDGRRERLGDLSTIQSGVQKDGRVGSQGGLERSPSSHHEESQHEAHSFDRTTFSADTLSFMMHEKRLSRQIEQRAISPTLSEQQRHQMVERQTVEVNRIKMARSIATESNRSNSSSASPLPLGTSTPIDKQQQEQMQSSSDSGQSTHPNQTAETEETNHTQQNDDVPVPPLVQDYLNTHPPRAVLDDHSSHFELTPSERTASAASQASTGGHHPNYQAHGVQTSDLHYASGVAQTTPSLQQRFGLPIRVHSDSHLSQALHSHHHHQQQQISSNSSRQPPPHFNIDQSFDERHLHNAHLPPRPSSAQSIQIHEPPLPTHFSYADAESLFPAVKRNLLRQLRDAIAHLDYAQSSLDHKGKQLLEVKRKLEIDCAEKLHKLEHDQEIWNAVKEKEQAKMDKEKRQLEKFRKDIEAGGNEREKALAQRMEELKNSLSRSETKNADLRCRVTTLERQLKEKTDEAARKDTDLHRGREVIAKKEKRINELTRKLEQQQREFAEQIGAGGKAIDTLQRAGTADRQAKLQSQMSQMMRRRSEPLQESVRHNAPRHSSDDVLYPSSGNAIPETSSFYHHTAASSVASNRPKSVSWEDEQNQKQVMRKVDERKTRLGFESVYRNHLGKWSRFVTLSCGDFLFEYSNGDVRWIDAVNVFEVYFTKFSKNIEVFIHNTRKSIRLFYSGRVGNLKHHFLKKNVKSLLFS